MPLNPSVIRESFDTIKPYSAEFITRFYDTLFKRYPVARALIKKDMELQKKALLKGLAYIVDNLESEEELVSYLQSMGSRHSDKYGALPEHYGWVAESFIDTLRYFFDDTWTTELEEQWTMALGFIAETMLSGSTPAVAEEKAPPSKPIPLGEQLQALVNQTITRAFNDHQITAELKKMAHAKASSILMQAFEEEVNRLKGEVSKGKAA